jgi:hypothetical protein
METDGGDPADPLLPSEGEGGRTASGIWGTACCSSFWLSPGVRFVADLGGILTFYIVGGLVGYEQGALWGGVVALFGVLTDWVRSQFYDPWFRFPKPLDSGEVLLYFLMYGLAVLSSEALFWYNAISSGGILVVLLAADACGYNVFIDYFREHPKMPRAVWSDDDGGSSRNYATERAELAAFASYLGKLFSALLFLLTVLASVVPAWTLIEGSRPDHAIRQLFNVWLQLAVFVGFVFEMRTATFFARPELSQSTAGLLEGMGMSSSGGGQPSTTA